MSKMSTGASPLVLDTGTVILSLEWYLARAGWRGDGVFEIPMQGER
jgi:hypothetical protein